MKTKNIILLSTTLVIFAACRAAKKNTTTTVTSVSAPTTVTAESGYNFPEVKSTTGVYPPGNEELTAIQASYKDVTLDILKQGYTIYTVGKCINCHASKNIYKREESKWKGIIDDMAERARISDAEKDAVYKYVLAIKATQAK